MQGLRSSRALMVFFRSLRWSSNHLLFTLVSVRWLKNVAIRFHAGPSSSYLLTRS
jgi:hypothetical protein